MITFTKEQLIASAHARIEFAEMMLSGELEPLKERTWSIELELARIALASLEAEAVSEFYHEARWGWYEISEGDKVPERARIPLYRVPPVPVSMKDHQIRELVNELRDIAVEYHGTQQLRERIARTVRAAMLQGADGTLTNEDAKRVGELVMLVKRLAHSLRKANPDSKLQNDAMDYLSRNGLIGVEDVLR